MKTRHEVVVEFLTAWPNYFIDAQGTVWTSREAVCEEFSEGDAWADEILGWCWEDALDNFVETQRIAKRRAFWKAHTRLRAVIWWALSRYRAVSLFLRIVWRRSGYFEPKDDYRLGWKLSWNIASHIWAREAGK